jgi:hypothetical protein
MHALCFAPIQNVFSDLIVVFGFDDWQSFAVLQSDIHREWALTYGSTLETRSRYTKARCFDTFPMPNPSLPTEGSGNRYAAHRSDTMLAREEGLTKIYNRFHNPKETTEDIRRLRELHIEMDHAVAAAYGWTDLDLGHGFHETKQGVRYTLSEAARREVLGRLLKLNHERYAEEVAQGLHDKGKKVKRKAVSGRQSAGSGEELLRSGRRSLFDEQLSLDEIP